MRRIFAGLGIVLGLVLMASPVHSGGTKEEKITQDKLPKKVLEAVKSWFAEPKFTALTKETTGDKVVYDLEFTFKGKKYEMDVKEDGTVLEIEKEVASKDLPAAVAKAVKDKFPKATVKEAMEVNLVDGKKLTLDHYEIIIETDGKSMEITVTPDGKKVGGGEKKAEKKIESKDKN
jgi:hypothetical protein